MDPNYLGVLCKMVHTFEGWMMMLQPLVESLEEFLK